MSLKIKLISCISAFILILGMFIAGVLSAQQAQVNIGGSISFNATDVYARVTGSVANAQSNPTLSDLLFTANDDSSPSESALATWSNMDLDFNQTPTPIEILITVENLSTERTLTVNLTNNLQGEGLNIAISRDSASYTSATNVELGTAGSDTDSTTFTLTLTVADPNEDLTDVNFGHILNMFDESVEIPISDFVFTTSGDTATLIEYTGVGGDVVIPSKISLSADGTAIVGSDYTVTAIVSSTSSSSSPFYSTRSTLTSITIPETIETIGNYAFYDCTYLTEINYDATAVSDLSSNNYVFSNAGQDGEGITVNIGANVERLPSYIFCPYAYGSSYSPNITTVNFVEGSQVSSIGRSAFYSCDGLSSITIPEKVTSIGNSAFAYCRTLTEINYNATAANDLSNYNNAFYAGQDGEGITINIGANVTRLPNYVFLSSSNVTTVIFAKDSQLTSIGQRAFGNCRSLNSITIPENVISIGSEAFDSCRALTEINYNATYANDLSSGNDIFGHAGQDGTGITVNIGANVTKLPSFLFGQSGNAGSPSIITVNFEEDSVCETIGSYAFSRCQNLASITIPSSVISIGSSAFDQCYVLAEVYNYSSLTIANNTSNGSVGYYAKVIHNLSTDDSKPVTRITVVDNMQYYEYGNDLIALAPTSRNVTEVILDNRTTEINQYAFQHCNGLTSITIPSSVTSIGIYVFDYCSSLTSIEVDPANANYSSEEGVLFNKDKTTLVAYPIGSTRTSYTIPNSVTSIGSGAFSYCSGLTSIIIPSSVSSIESSAFSNCSGLTSITIPSSVTNISSYAFANSGNLNDVTIESDDIYLDLTGPSACGYLINYVNATGETVRVLKSVVDSVDPNFTVNTYLNGSNFDRSEEGDYYVYTHI